VFELGMLIDHTDVPASGRGTATLGPGPGPDAGTGASPGPWLPGIPEVSPGVGRLAGDLQVLVAGDLPEMGLTAGLRPAGDVDALLTAVAQVEYELARRMHAATRAGALPLAGDGAMPLARYWSPGWSRRLARAGGFAARFPGIAGPWAAGIITSEHVDALARREADLTGAEMTALIEQLADRWGRHTPQALAGFIARVIRALRPPTDPEPDEADAYTSRNLSFALLGDTVLLTGSLPRLEGEAVIAAVDAWADRLRTAADHTPAAARRADGLVALVNAAATAGGLPSRGGLPVALTVTLAATPAGDLVATTSRGHPLTPAETRYTTCTATITPILVEPGDGCPGSVDPAPGTPDPPGATDPAPTAGNPATPAQRINALAAALLDSQIPLAVGRTHRHATGAQRRALAARDRGCVIPGCQVPAEACQAHHLVAWSEGGETTLTNMALVCWTHHRQVDLGMWTIHPTDPHQPPVPPDPGAPPGTSWPANHGAPWTVTATPRSQWGAR
jgi:hypothetical protein